MLYPSSFSLPCSRSTSEKANSTHQEEPNSLPGLFAQTKKGVFVASGVDQTGQLWPKSQWIPGAAVIFAVSVDVTCIGSSGSTTATGTSFGTQICLHPPLESCGDGLVTATRPAAPQVAGLISYFQAINLESANPIAPKDFTAWVYDKIFSLAYPRTMVAKGTPREPATGWPLLSMINNGVNPNDCTVQKRGLAGRDAPVLDACPLAASSTTSSIPSPSATDLGGGLTPPGTRLGTPDDQCQVNPDNCSCACLSNDDCGTGCGQYVSYCNATTGVAGCCLCNL